MTSWVRLWHDMPTDPKFRTIARAAKQPLPTVVAVFTFLLADASANENERGRTTATDEDIASAFDIEESDVAAIKKAMQGRVLDGDMLAGWSKRQPKKEDDSAERAKAWRLKKQAEADAERSRTLPNDAERPETDTDTDQNQKESPPSPPEGDARRLYDALVGFYPSTPNTKARNAERLFLKLSPDEQRLTIPAAKAAADAARQDRQKRGRSLEEHWGFIPGLDTWLREGRWKALPAAPSGPVTLMTKLDRELDADLWKACEQVMGKKAPTSGLTWSFDNAVIEQARQVAA